MTPQLTVNIGSCCRLRVIFHYAGLFLVHFWAIFCYFRQNGIRELLMSHQAVLLKPTVDGLSIHPNGIYIDGTFGRGGHSRYLLDQLGPKGQLLAIDKDMAAICHGKDRWDNEPRIQFHHQGFKALKALCQKHDLLGQIDGIMVDLGVSSPQLDTAERGVSFSQEGPLDMRMDPSSGESVAQWLAHASEEDISRVLFEYGQERFAKRIAKKIIAVRQEQSINTTTDLVKIITDVMPYRDRHKHPATRSFQALRIFINQELDELDQLLQDSLSILKVGGRMAVISFHSLEDRRVKKFVQSYLVNHTYIPAGLAAERSTSDSPVKWVIKKHFPTEDEINQNPRARSAVLRIFERSL